MTADPVAALAEAICVVRGDAHADGEDFASAAAVLAAIDEAMLK